MLLGLQIEDLRYVFAHAHFWPGNQPQQVDGIVELGLHNVLR